MSYVKILKRIKRKVKEATNQGHSKDARRKEQENVGRNIFKCISSETVISKRTKMYFKYPSAVDIISAVAELLISF